MDSHKHGESIGPDWVEDPDRKPFSAALEQLREYFDGERQAFDLPLAPIGPSFHRRVWEALQTVPFAATISYKELAARVDKPGGVRAVGQSNGRNPISIIIPCHRVIGTNGSLTGYGGGLERKKALLEFEAAVLKNGPRPFTIRSSN
jgi:methylated-DNA-[protein]-cysteine S-methyltransferase